MPVCNPEPIELEIDDYCLRLPHLNDVAGLTTGMGDRQVSTMMASVPFPCPREVVSGWVEIVRARWASGVGAQFVIAGQNPVGVVGFSGFGTSADLGYWLLPSAQGKGLMTAAARAALTYAFTHGAKTVVSGAFADNPASLRVQQKLGFDIVGERRIYSLARRDKVAHIDTRMTANTFLENG